MLVVVVEIFGGKLVVDFVTFLGQSVFVGIVVRTNESSLAFLRRRLVVLDMGYS